MIQVTPVILCGGSGTRLWPLSRTGFPKQFLCLTGNESLFQQAAQRLAGLGDDSIQVAAPVIVSGEDHRFLASEQLREVGIALGTALLEPTGRNTAPALTLAALAAVQNGQDPVLVVTPADQTIANPIAFTAAVQQAIAQAEQGNIVILGVTPDKPETGYGYIRIDPRYFRPTEVETLLGDPSKAKHKLGWVPEITLDQMIEEMATTDLAEAKKHALLKKHGYYVSVSVE